MGVRRRARLAGAHCLPSQEEEARAGAAKAVRAEGIPAEPSKPSILPSCSSVIPANSSNNPTKLSTNPAKPSVIPSNSSNNPAN